MYKYVHCKQRFPLQPAPKSFMILKGILDACYVAEVKITVLILIISITSARLLTVGSENVCMGIYIHPENTRYKIERD